MTDHTKELAEVLADAVAKLDSQLAKFGGCTDGGCLVVRPKGMHTHGGCKCLTSIYSEGPMRVRHFAQIHNKFADEVRAASTTPRAVARQPPVDRSDAVNLARNMLEVHDCKGITTAGVRILCDGVMRMDAALAAQHKEKA